MSALTKHTLPTLTANEERELARAWRDRRDTKARDKIIMSSLPFAKDIIGKRKRVAEQDDLEQEAAMQMMVALDRFDPERGVRFITYAKSYIKVGVQSAEIGARPITLPAVAFQAVGSGKSKRLSDESIEAAQQSVAVVSLDAPVDRGPLSRDRVVTRLDRYVDAATLPDDDDSADRVAELMAQCTPLEKFIFTRRFTDEKLLAEVGDELGISRQRDEQLERAGLERLRERQPIDIPRASNPFWSEEADALRSRFGGQSLQLHELSAWAAQRYAIKAPTYLRHLLAWCALEGRASLHGETVCILSALGFLYARSVHARKA